MARAFEVKTNVTVDAGTKGIRPDGSDGVGRTWATGSIVELADPAEIASLLRAGAISAVGEKNEQEPAAEEAQPVPAAQPKPKK
jgi:hypothetical protein